MTSNELRASFLQFFRDKQHTIVPSAPMVIKNDPTLMFTNAGMNQFKDYFLGNRKAEFTRVADTQKCLRVSGKHNDLEEVGMDTYHHTMFEMLGNWSFGDYFKKEAIDWAWELLTEVFELPAERMYATVFEGDDSENLERDNEAADIWSKHLPKERILNGNKKDNFWEMGDTGPCGPCSEIHIDLRPESEISKKPGVELVNQDHPQVVEIWNLVFIQFNRKADGSLENLPARHVDTGMGFERLAMAIQGKQSNYDTDVFQPLIDEIARQAGVQYGNDEKIDIALRVISDHIRAIAFTISDGQLPGNAKAGYVVRRILRRAVRYGYTFLNFQEPFLHTLIPMVAEQFKDVFPELIQQKDFVSKVIKEEEISFLRTLEKGLKRFESLKAEASSKVISGKDAFEMYDTYGFPLDLTSLIARENGLSVDEKEFEEQMKVQKDRSKAAAQQDTSDWEVIRDTDDHSTFVGYENATAETRIVKVREITQKDKKFYQVVTETTPFYAESGGQVGDKGVMQVGEEAFPIFDTRKENDLIVHYMRKIPADLTSVVTMKIDEKKRLLTQNNHTATHLMHAALRQVLGDHVQQRGSLVNAELLRFDFSHFAKMTGEEIAEVERIVNRKIRENISLDEKRNVPIEDAKEMGAMALFGEKYGDFVRVITFDSDYSVELCGGTHVPSTGAIGLFKIVSESSSAAGVRRIEAITADAAEDYINQKLDLLADISEQLKNPKDLSKAISSLLEERAGLQKKLEELNKDKAKSIKSELLSSAMDKDGTKIIFHNGQFPDSDALKQLSFELKNEVESLLMIVAADIDGKPILSVMMSDDLVRNHGLNAGQMVREMAKHIKGGGGGQPFYATAGGKDVNGLSQALEKGKSIVKENTGWNV
jgi:alanyl-tRNA synthetase